jgi:hypothetical protein
MNFQWLNQNVACPIVEFHDLRTEKFRFGRYLSLVEDRLTAPMLAAGGLPLGQFRAENHPDRVILLRGFSSTEARRRALTAFHAGPDWAHHRAEAANLLREERVLLTRAVVPADGLRQTRSGDRLVAMISEVKFAEQLGNYHLWLRLLLRKAGMDPIAAFATLEAVNDVPAVPVVRHRSHHVALMRSSGGVPELPRELRGTLRYPPEVLALEPASALVW